MQFLQTTELPQCFLLRLFRHLGFRDLGAEFLDLYLLLVALAQLTLDGLELLAQEVLALHLLHLGLSLGLDFLAQLQHFEFVVEDGGKMA